MRDKFFCSKTMRYKVFCSNGHDSDSFYFDSQHQAALFYKLAIQSELFVYVSYEDLVEGVVRREWTADVSQRKAD